MEQYGVIYMLYNNTNGHAYIGQSINFDQRMNGHFHDSQHRPICLVDQKIKQYGWDNFDKLIIATGYDKAHLDELEKYYIIFYETQAKYGHGHYNIKSGGSGGGKPDQKTRAKMSKAKKGDRHPYFGKTRSEETKRKISTAQSGNKSHCFGKTPSVETKAKLSESMSGNKNHNFGKSPSSETRSKLSEANRNNMKMIECLETGQIFESIAACTRGMGVRKNNLSDHLCGRRKSVKGFHFRYIKKDNE